MEDKFALECPVCETVLVANDKTIYICVEGKGNETVIWIECPYCKFEQSI